jgi:hypothetical protein
VTDLKITQTGWIVLKYAADNSLSVDPTTDPEKIIDLFQGFGVSYDVYFDKAMATLHQFQTDQANWYVDQGRVTHESVQVTSKLSWICC